MEKVGVVILNYKKYQETIECVNSALEQEGIEMHIVIVDNGSKNESLKIITEKYSNRNNITILSSLENLGYAKGNNIGIRFLREKGYKFIFVANSDISFSSNNIIATLTNNYDSTDGVLVPIVRNMDGTIEQRETHIKKLFSLRLIKTLLKAIYFRNVKGNVDKEKNYNEMNKKLVGKLVDRYSISGSAFMLTPAFFKNYQCLYPKTFLYCEEIATMIYLHKARLFTKIVDTEDVIHKGAASSSNSTKEKDKFVKQSAKRVLPLIFKSKKNIAKKYR